MRSRRAAALVTVAAVALASSCVRPTRERLVVLSSSTAAAPVARDAAATIALGRIRVPEYLDGYDIITRTSPHELQRVAGSRWAERLPDAAARVLRDALTANGVQVADDASNVVSVEIAAFEARADGVVVLSAAWEVLDDERQRLADDTRVTEQPAEPGAAGQAAAMEIALRHLAADIAATIKALPATRAAAEPSLSAPSDAR